MKENGKIKIIKKYCKIDPKDIAYLKYILEAYDNIGNLSTINRKEGEICLFYSNFFEDDVKKIIKSLNISITGL